MTGIKTGDELVTFLKKAQEIEMMFETGIHWEGYISVRKDEFRDVLFKLISDSEKHKNMVDYLISRVKNVRDSRSAPLPPRSVSFKNKAELEIMMEIGGYEKLVHDLYVNIRDALKESEMKLFMEEKDIEPFMKDIERLIAEETGHMAIVSKYVGKIERVR